MSVISLAREYADQQRLYDTMKEAAEAQKAAVRKAEEKLYAALIDEGVTAITLDGVGVLRPVSNVKATCRAGMQQNLFDALRENGYGDVIKESVNANTLNALIKDVIALAPGNVPGWVSETCNLFNVPTISVRSK